MPTGHEFQVEMDEKHLIRIKFSGWTGHFKVFVDGKEVIDKWILTRMYYARFMVGNKEKHQIELRAYRRVFSWPRLQVRVDREFGWTTLNAVFT